MSNDGSTFIGGLNDGRRMFVPSNLPIVRVPIPSRETHSGLPFESFSELPCESFRKERIATSKQVFEFYVHEHMPLEDAIDRLISRYKRPEVKQ